MTPISQKQDHWHGVDDLLNRAGVLKIKILKAPKGVARSSQRLTRTENSSVCAFRTTSEPDGDSKSEGRPVDESSLKSQNVSSRYIHTSQEAGNPKQTVID